MLNSAIHMFEDIGRLSMAAKYYKVHTFMVETYNLIHGTVHVNKSAMRIFSGLEYVTPLLGLRLEEGDDGKPWNVF
jgi:hypothetical protein